MTLTATQIKGILEDVIYPEEVQINAALLQNDERRKYPSIDVQNVTGEEQLKEFPSTTTSQTFLVHLFYRYRSFGEQEESKIKAIENEIFDVIDQNASFSTDTKISVTQGWQRDSETFPVRRSHSVLRVTANELTSTSGDGIPGDEITITFPTIGLLKVISLATDERSINKQLDLTDSAERIFTKISNTDLLIVEVELSTTTESQLATQVHDGNDISVTLTKKTVNQALTVNLTSMVGNATRSSVQSTLVTMNVKS